MSIKNLCCLQLFAFEINGKVAPGFVAAFPFFNFLHQAHPLICPISQTILRHRRLLLFFPSTKAFAMTLLFPNIVVLLRFTVHELNCICSLLSLQSRTSLVSSSDGGILAEGETSSESSDGSESPPCDLGLVERLLRTHPVWFLPGIQRAGAVHLLQGKEEGVSRK